MKMILKLLICGVFIAGISGCSNPSKETIEKEQFMMMHRLEDGRKIYSSFDIPYYNNSLSVAFLNGEISVSQFLDSLDFIDTLKDGGSKVYKYNKSMEVFGNDNFYVVSCNSLDNIHDIYVAEYRENLSGLCSIKIDDLDGVSMTMKDITTVGATLIITDTTDRVV